MSANQLEAKIYQRKWFFYFQQHHLLSHEQYLHKQKHISECWAKHLKGLKLCSESVSAGTHLGHR